MRSLLLAAMVLALSPGSTNAMQAGVPMGRIEVPPKVMAENLITMVSPNYPLATGDSPEASFVVVRVVISRTGSVFPIRAVSGPPGLQAEAMNAVRLWRYKPFVRDGEALDITTEVRVDFTPGTPGGMVSHPKHLATMQ
jgi:periplasmic protein TonB